MINIYIHIDKCGGSSVRSYILTRYKNVPDCVIKVYGENSFKGTGLSIKQFTERFATGLSTKVYAVVGHTSYSILEPILQETVIPFKLFTCVRDPIDRIISAINFNKMKHARAGRSNHSFIHLNKDNIYEYILSLPANHQFNYLKSNNKEVSVSEISKKINLYKVSNIDNILQDMGIFAHDLELPRKNITKDYSKLECDPNYVTIQDLSSHQLAHIKEINQLDYELYNISN